MRAFNMQGCRREEQSASPGVETSAAYYTNITRTLIDTKNVLFFLNVMHQSFILSCWPA